MDIGDMCECVCSVGVGWVVWSWWLYGMDCLGCCEKKNESLRDGAMAAHLLVVNTKLKWQLVDCWWVGLDMYVCMFAETGVVGSACVVEKAVAPPNGRRVNGEHLFIQEPCRPDPPH
jgi:hypothetical protein